MSTLCEGPETPSLMYHDQKHRDFPSKRVRTLKRRPGLLRCARLQPLFPHTFACVVRRNGSWCVRDFAFRLDRRFTISILALRCPLQGWESKMLERDSAAYRAGETLFGKDFQSGLRWQGRQPSHCGAALWRGRSDGCQGWRRSVRGGDPQKFLLVPNRYHPTCG